MADTLIPADYLQSAMKAVQESCTQFLTYNVAPMADGTSLGMVMKDCKLEDVLEESTRQKVVMVKMSAGNSPHARPALCVPVGDHSSVWDAAALRLLAAQTAEKEDLLDAVEDFTSLIRLRWMLPSNLQSAQTFNKSGEFEDLLPGACAVPGPAILPTPPHPLLPSQS